MASQWQGPKLAMVTASFQHSCDYKPLGHVFSWADEAEADESSLVETP